MTLTREVLTDVAAIAAAAPRMQLRLGTAHGASVVVGEHPHGAMCVDGFRELLAAWVEGHEPRVETVDFVGASYVGGLLTCGGMRFFATRLSAQETAACLRERGDWPEEAHAVVREDLLLDVSVVQVLSSELDDDALDAAARDAQAACLVEELCREVSAA
ncbi:hypothetical protein [Demequina mangrovi]|uniref:Uncharacterized protein n=1 Tax=Demequina mangrovi TaxID=1043493 RepID=A0A1H6Y1F7_9MICO|nr:hypothetical protein [Demequina mangrovi]SEJ35129.1 hypothetical protein SAMN05421637_1520 [Demequina mangrovi]